MTSAHGFLTFRTGDLIGLPIPRPVLSNLENGRRESVSMAEVLVLAQALEIPPVLLVAPVGITETVEILPNGPRATWDAAKWITSEDKYADGWIQRPYTAMVLWRRHEEAERVYEHAARQLATLTPGEERDATLFAALRSNQPTCLCSGLSAA